MSITPAGWGRAYRPLHPLSLSLQLLVLVLAEVALFASYGAHDARFHWATHFLVALAFTAFILLSRLLLTGAPGPRFLLLTVLGFHLYAMAPDLLFRGGVPHYRWMDVFLGHVAAHYLPGGDGSWLAIALTMTGLYVAALTAWLRARRTEAQLGMPPGVGLTGMAVLRAQRDPRTDDLAHVEHGDGDATVVLLHGLGASSAFWRPVATRLNAAGCRTIAPDLLGFASSIRLGTHFHLDDQTAAVIRLLERHPKGPGATQVWLVAHSYGATVAAAVAKDRPDLVKGLVLVAPAAFAGAAETRERIGRRSWVARKAMSGSPVADVACGAMCLLRLPLTALAPRVATRISPDIPAEVARDGVSYVWPAYRDALTSLLEGNPLPAWLAEPALPTTVIIGTGDETVRDAELTAMLGPAVGVVRVDGSHSLPLNARRRSPPPSWRSRGDRRSLPPRPVLAAVAYAVAFGLSAGQVFFSPAGQSLLPSIVGDDELVAANSGIWTAAVTAQIAVAPVAPPPRKGASADAVPRLACPGRCRCVRSKIWLGFGNFLATVSASAGPRHP